MDFKEMMANRGNLVEKAAEFVTAGGFKKDDRFWEPTLGKDGNGSATFRFVPQKDFNLNPMVIRMRHNFKKGGKSLYEFCPKTIGWDEECPVCDDLNPLYDDYVDTPQGKKFKFQAAIDLLKRKKENIINIYMIDDPGNPDNNGKVFLYKMNGNILKLYKAAINPPTELVKPCVVWDYIEGADFLFIVIAPEKKGDYNDYDMCKFQSPSQIADTEDKMKEIWEMTYELNEFIDPVISPKMFNSYADINKKFRSVYYGEVQGKEIPGSGQQLNSDTSTIVDSPFDTKDDGQKPDNEQPQETAEKLGYEDAPINDEQNVDESKIGDNADVGETNKDESAETPDDKKADDDDDGFKF